MSIRLGQWCDMMNNFTFYNPTKLIFGKGSISRLSGQIPSGSKILLVYGGGSIIENGIYDEVMSELEGFEVTPFGGIEPNPDCLTIDRAIEVAREKNIDFLLAVGGGSVLDATKVIGAGFYSSLKAWDLVMDGGFDRSLPVGTVLTVPATGSEMNRGSVISNRETAEKYSYYSQHPVFSILDPTYTYTLSEHQVACGIADTFMHTLEQYLTYSGQSGLMDRLAEGLLLNVLDFAPIRLKKPEDYDVACEYMLSATFGLNGMIGMGVEQDWLTHKIGHEVTALTGATHGASLMMVLPSLLRVLKEPKRSKLLQLGERVFGLSAESEENLIEATIVEIEQFIHSLGLSASLKEGGVDITVAEEIARRFEVRGESWGEGEIGTPEKIREILQLAMQ